VTTTDWTPNQALISLTPKGLALAASACGAASADAALADIRARRAVHGSVVGADEEADIRAAYDALVASGDIPAAP
jgi:hypothetical protein